MSQRVTVMTTKPDDLSSIPEAHIVEGQSQLAQLSSTCYKAYHKILIH